jgi:hypothetical protein
LIGLGAVVVRASQDGNMNYLAAPSVDRSFDVTAITGVEYPFGDQVKLTPNPSSGDCTLSVPETWRGARVKIYDTKGILVYEQENISDNTSIKSSRFAAGLHLVYLTNPGTSNTLTRRLIKY